MECMATSCAAFIAAGTGMGWAAVIIAAEREGTVAGVIGGAGFGFVCLDCFLLVLEDVEADAVVEEAAESLTDFPWELKLRARASNKVGRRCL